MNNYVAIAEELLNDYKGDLLVDIMSIIFGRLNKEQRDSVEKTFISINKQLSKKKDN